MTVQREGKEGRMYQSENEGKNVQRQGKEGRMY